MLFFSTQADFLAALRAEADPAYPRHEVVGIGAVPAVVTCALNLRGLSLKHPVRIEQVTFWEPVDFSEWRCESSLRLERCKFRNGLYLADTRVEGLCSLARSKFHAPADGSLDFRRLHVGGLLDCTRVIATASLNFARLHAGNDVWFNYAKIRVPSRDSYPALNIDGADVGGSVFFRDRVRVTGRIDLRAKVGGQVNFGHAALTTRDDLVAVDMDAAVVGGSVFFGDGAWVTGRIDLRAKVGGQVNFGRAAVTARDDLVAVDMGAADVGGGVFFNPETRVTGRIDLRAKVGVNVEFLGAAVTARDDLKAVDMERAVVGGSVFFRDGTRVTGQVDLRARVGGQVSFTNATVTARDDLLAVDLEQADVGGGVFFNPETRVTGWIDLRAKVGENVEFLGATVTARDDLLAVDMERAVVGGSVLFRDGIQITGRLDLRARVGRQVSFSRATVTTREDLKAVDMDAAVVGGSVFFRDGARVTGRIDLRAKVGGQVNFGDTSVTARDDLKAVDMDAADVGGGVFFNPETRVTGRIDLRAKVGVNVEFLGAAVTARDDLKAVVMERAVIGGSVFFRDGTRVTGQVDLRARVGGQVSFNDVTVTARDDLLAVDLEQADVGGSVFFLDGSRVNGGIDLRARIGGQVVFSGTSILAAAGTRALRMDGAEVRSQVFLVEGVWVRGHLHLKGAKIGGGLVATRRQTAVTFVPPDTEETTRHVLIDGDWDMSFADVSGPVQLHGVSLCGRFVARHLTVHGDLDLCGSVLGKSDADTQYQLATTAEHHRQREASLTGYWQRFEVERPAVPAPDGATPDQLVAHRAIDLELAEVNGRLWIKQSWVLGTAHLEDATVVGEANFEGADVLGDLVLRSAEIKGQVFADEREGTNAYPRVSGGVDLSFATVQRASVMVGHAGASMTGLRLAHATVQQVDVKFARSARAVAPEYLDLKGATIESLRLSGNVREGQPPFLVTESLRFNTLDCDTLTVRSRTRRVSPADRRRYAAWAVLVGLALALAVAQWSGLAFVVLAYAAYAARSCLRGWTRRYLYPSGWGGPTAAALCLRGCPWRRPVVALRRALADWRRDPVVPLRRPTLAEVLRRVAVEQWRWCGVWFRRTSLRRGRARRPAAGVRFRRTYLRRCRVFGRPVGLLDHLDQTYPFSSGHYVLVERKLREAGNDAAADEVLLLRRRRETGRDKTRRNVSPRMRDDGHVERPPELGPATRRLYSCLDFLMGFGVRPWRLVNLYVVLGLLNAAVFLNPRSVERPVAYVQHRTDSPQWGSANPKPSGGSKSTSPRWKTLPTAATRSAATGKGRPDARESRDYAFVPPDGEKWPPMKENPWPSDGGMPDEAGEDAWSAGHAVFMSLRVQVPVLALVAENDWSPATRPMAVCPLLSYADYASIMMVINLILIPLIVAGLTGYLKK